MSQFAEHVLQGRHVLSISKNPINKNRLELTDNILFPAKAIVLHRGKETMFQFVHHFSGTKVFWDMRINYGMSGHWAQYRTPFGNKHSMLSLELDNGVFLEFIDPRRFGRWKVGNRLQWGNQGPNILGNSFLKFILDSRDNPDLRKPICEVLLNQKYWNGIGNYLRAELLGRAGINPFTFACHLDDEEYVKIVENARSCIHEVIDLGGGKLFTWKNPLIEGRSKLEFKDWLQYYRKGSWCVDGTKRRFWYDPAFESECPYVKSDI